MIIEGINIPEALLTETQDEMKRRTRLPTLGAFAAGDLVSWLNRGQPKTEVPKGLDHMRFVDRLIQRERKAGRIRFSTTARVWVWIGG